jgi:hypothetical protein
MLYTVGIYTTDIIMRLFKAHFVIFPPSLERTWLARARTRFTHARAVREHEYYVAHATCSDP